MAERIEILALDVATSTGWACGPAAGPVDHGTWTLGKGETLGAKMGCLYQHIEELMAERPIKGIYQERPVMFTSGQSNANATASAAAIGNVPQMVAWLHGIPHGAVHVSTLKKFITGSGRASKLGVMTIIRAYGFNPANDDEGDALAAWLFGCSQLAPKTYKREWALKGMTQ